jgi:formylglycine-generating enzyme required for sulfatase activity
MAQPKQRVGIEQDLQRHVRRFIAVALTSALPHAAGAQEQYADSIPGTLVRFDMVGVPALGLWVSKTEVTWDLYDAFALSQADSTENRRAAAMDAVARPTRPYGAPDYGWGHTGYPVISVAHTAAAAFCEWLSARTGKKYRLPTEKEWEQIARLAAAGGSSADRAWHAGNAGGTTHRVGQKPPDALGLHDLFGNAAEWVTVDSGPPVVRGGSFRDAPAVVGPTARAVRTYEWNERDPQIPQSRWWMSDAPFAGFRIVRVP